MEELHYLYQVEMSVYLCLSITIYHKYKVKNIDLEVGLFKTEPI